MVSLLTLFSRSSAFIVALQVAFALGATTLAPEQPLCQEAFPTRPRSLETLPLKVENGEEMYTRRDHDRLVASVRLLPTTDAQPSTRAGVIYSYYANQQISVEYTPPSGKQGKTRFFKPPTDVACKVPDSEEWRSIEGAAIWAD